MSFLDVCQSFGELVESYIGQIGVVILAILLAVLNLYALFTLYKAIRYALYGYGFDVGISDEEWHQHMIDEHGDPDEIPYSSDEVLDDGEQW